MVIDKQCMVELAELVADAVLKALEKRETGGKTNGSAPKDKTAYQKTEQLMYNYVGFKRVVEERLREIEEIRVHGVPGTCGSVGERVQGGLLPHGIVLPEESVENAVRSVEASVQQTVRVISLIDKGLERLKSDPYYKILEMRYFEGRTQEDIALVYNCSQVTISKNKSRLIKQLSMYIFPNQVAEEMLQ